MNEADHFILVGGSFIAKRNLHRAYLDSYKVTDLHTTASRISKFTEAFNCSVIYAIWMVQQHQQVSLCPHKWFLPFQVGRMSTKDREEE